MFVLCNTCAHPVRCSNMERCLQGKIEASSNPSLDVKLEPQHVNTSQGDRMTSTPKKPSPKAKLKKVVKK